MKKLLVWLLAVCMILSVMPISAIAVTDENNSSNVEVTAPTIISSADELLAFADAVNAGDKFAGKVVELGADIDLANIEWSPIGGDSVYFAGEFDGKGYTISNLTQTNGVRMGLFGMVEKSYIHDLTLKDVEFEINGDNARVGAIAGNLQYWYVIENVTIDGINITANGKDGLIGTVAGYVWKSQLGNVDVKNAVIEVNGTGNVIGGHTAYGRGHVWDTNVTANNANWLEGTVQIIDGVEYVLQNYYVDCNVDGVKIALNGNGSEAGGFFGSDTYNSHSNYFTNCHVTGLDVTAAEGTSQTVGGFIAYSSGTTAAGTVKGFENCSVTGKIEGANGTYGGFVGTMLGRAKAYNGASADVDIVCTGTAGGFVGRTANTHQNNATSSQAFSFTNCEATGDVTAAVAGGFIGNITIGSDASKRIEFTATNCSASGKVTGTEAAGGFAGKLDGSRVNIADSYANLIACKGSEDVTGPNGKTTDMIGLATGNASHKTEITVPAGNTVNSDENVIVSDIDAVALVGSKPYESFVEAVKAANEASATVTLLKDVTLGEKLTITGKVTISGNKTITRAKAYAGTLFAVNAGATLTLDGGVIVDGANNYQFDSAAYAADLADWENYVPKEDSAKWFTPEEGAPIANGHMITVAGGTVNLNDVTVQNNYGISTGVVKATAANSTVNLNGAQIKHIAATQGNGVAVLSEHSGNKVTMNEGTVIDGNHVGGNHGIFKVYSGTVFTMNGGEIKNTTGWNSNGTAIGIFNATFTMNGGTICSNSSVYGPNNGRNAAVYGHNGHLFTMNGGTICHNSGRSKAGVDSPYSEIGYTGSTIINGGSVLDNDVIGNWTEPDVSGGATLTINGGTFTQDVSDYLAPNTGLSYNAATGTYGIAENVFNLYFRDPVTGEQLTYVGPLKGSNAAELVRLGKAFYANYYVMELEVLSNVKIDETIVIDYPMTVNLNGKKITTAAVASEDELFDAFTILSDVTFTGDGTVDARPSKGYTFYVGDKDGNAGNLTIENGTYYGDTSVVNNRLGTVTINGGEFGVVPYNDNYEFTINCIDANYKNGTAKIVVNGGTFYKFNPENNAAEGAQTSFVTGSYLAEKDGDYYVVRVNKDTLDTLVDITFTDSNSGNKTTLKYPSERYDSIQKLIGTNDYADFVLGAEQSELLAYIANGRASDIVITLYDDIKLDAPINFYNKYYSIPVEYDITLDGNGHTITWADGYAGTLINVESGVSLTTKDLTIDGENAFTFYSDTTTVENGQNWYTRFVNVGEEDKAVNANVFVNAGNLTLGKGTVIKNVTIASTGGNGKTENTDTGYILKYNDDLAIVYSTGGKVNINEAAIIGNAGMILNADNTTTVIKNSKIDGNMGCGRNGGIIDLVGGTMTLTDAEITNNKAMARDATIIGITTGAEVEMNGDSKIENNKHIGVGGNTAGSMIVVRENSKFTMNGGSISNNAGGRAGAIASRWADENANIVLNAGVITGNTADEKYGWSGAAIYLRSPAEINSGMTIDGVIAVNSAPSALNINGGTHNGSLVVNDGRPVEISGGTFNYDPTPWLANGYAVTENSGVWSVDTAIVVSAYSKVNGEKFWIEFNSDSFDVLKHVEMMDHDNYNWVLTLKNDIEITDTVLIGKDLTIDLSGYTIKTAEGVMPAFRIIDGANVTVKNGTIDADGYCFILGASDGSSAGNLTIESGIYNASITVASVTKGVLTILDGEFKAEPYNGSYEFTLNCIDANYKNGTAKIVVSGGKFYKFNPENNAAEGAGTNFAAEGYAAIADGEWYTVDIKTSVTIGSVEELIAFGNAVTNNTKYQGVKVSANSDVVVTLTADLDLANSGFAPIGNGAANTFSGTFDGQGHTISNMTLSCDYYRGVGFFRSLGKGAVVKNVIFENANVNNGNASGANHFYGIVAGFSNGLTLDNVDVKNSTVTCKYAGAIMVGCLEGASVIKNCDISDSTLSTTSIRAAVYGTLGNSANGHTATLENNTLSNVGSLVDGELKPLRETLTYAEFSNDNSDYTNSTRVAKIGDTQYSTLFDAITAAKDGDIITLIADIVLAETRVIDKNITIDLSGYTIRTVEGVMPAFRIIDGANVTVKNGTIDADGYCFILGASDGSSAGNLTIESGIYDASITVASVTKGTLNILGGEFKAEPYNGSYEFTLNCIDANYKNGTAKIVVSGGKFYKFNPENNAAEGAGTNFAAEGYAAIADGDYYNVISYVEWVQAQLFAGNSVTLDRDIVITDYDLVHAHKWPSNGNGKYNEAHGNGAIFHIIKPGVSLDLNGHSIIWDAHHDDYCNKRQVSLFMVTATGNAGETSDFTIKDSAGTGKIDVYGMGTAVYVVGVDAKATIMGGTFTNYPCKTCGASNIFIYPSHGGKLFIEGGTFEQKGSEYLLGWKGSSKPTNNNGVGVDFDETEVIISGGTFINFDPEKVKFFDTANSGQEIINGCDDGFIGVPDADGNYTVEVGEWIAKIGDVRYESLAEAIAAVKNGETIILLTDCSENVTITQKSGLNFTINGDNHIYSGKITVKGRNNASALETLTIKNINFKTNVKSHVFIDATENQVQNLTVTGCTFASTATDENGVVFHNGVVAIKIKQSGNVTVENCTADPIYYLVYNTSGGRNLVVDGCTVNGFYGIRVNNCIDAVIKNTTFNTSVHAIVLDSGNQNSVTTIESCTINVANPDRYPVYYNEPSAKKIIAIKGSNNFGTENWLNTVSNADVKVIIEDAGTAIPAGFVAKIGNAYYNSLQFAINDANENETVTLIDNIVFDSSDYITTDSNYKVAICVTGKNITLDMNGKSISVEHLTTEEAERLYAVIFVEDGAGLTVTGNGSIDAKADTTTPRIAYLFWKRGTTGYLVIENGTYHMNDSEDSMIYTNGNEIVTVKGGEFTLDSVGTDSNGSPWIFNVKGQNDKHLIVTGGTYNDDVSHQYWAHEVEIPEGYYCKNNGDGTWTVLPGAVAAVKENNHGYDRWVGFGDLSEALEAATKNGYVVKLVADTVTEGYVIVTPGVTLDLNGKTLNATYVVGFGGSNVIDSSAAKTGRLVANKTSVVLDKNNSMLPIYDSVNGCYVFVTANLEGRYRYDEAKDIYMAGPQFGEDTTARLLGNSLIDDGYVNSGVKVVVRLTWIKDGEYYATQDYTYVDKYVQEYVSGFRENKNGKWVYHTFFAASFSGEDVSDATELMVSTVLISDTGVELESGAIDISAYI